MQKILKGVKHHNGMTNISKKEKGILKDLKQKPYIYLPSDKGGEFCVVEKSSYINAGFQHLQDDKTYLRTTITPKTIELRINSKWKTIAKLRGIPKYIIRSYTSNNTTIPKFYHLIKTHKPGNDMKIRPIVSNCNGPTMRLAWLLTKLLTPLLKLVPAHLENSSELINNINATNYDRDVFKYPCSYDVVSLYTSIPIQDAIINIISKMKENNIQNIGLLQIEDIEELLETLMLNTFLCYEGQIFKQITGLPMGCSLSGLMAIMFMDTIEKTALRAFGSIGIFRRYVDDCFALVRDRGEAEQLLALLNSQHHNIKFEIELPESNETLSLLDFKVSFKNNIVTTEFYRKKARKRIFVNYNSHLPNTQKGSILINEMNRIDDRCTSTSMKTKHKQLFFKTLHLNDYPLSFISKTLDQQKHMKGNKQKQKNDNILNFKIPYINDKINRKIKNAFKSEGIDVRLCHRSYTLRNALKQRDPAPTICSLVNCKIKNTSLCFRRNIVYRMKCEKCDGVYIGSTIRHLHQRVREHHTDRKSSVYQHIQVCQGSFETTIIDSDPDSANLRLREGLLIRQFSPSINSRAESEEMAMFLF